jgi:transcriptional regulator with XRE-family HTH domain
VTHSRSQRLGSALRKRRTQRTVTQARLAELSGISVRHLSFIENGRAKPGGAVLKRVMSALMLPLRERNAMLELAGYARERVHSDTQRTKRLRTREERAAIADPLSIDLLRIFSTPGRSATMAAALLKASLIA